MIDKSWWEMQQKIMIVATLFNGQSSYKYTMTLMKKCYAERRCGGGGGGGGGGDERIGQGSDCSLSVLFDASFVF